MMPLIPFFLEVFTKEQFDDFGGAQLTSLLGLEMLLSSFTVDQLEQLKEIKSFLIEFVQKLFETVRKHYQVLQSEEDKTDLDFFEVELATRILCYLAKTD